MSGALLQRGVSFRESLFCFFGYHLQKCVYFDYFVETWWSSLVREDSLDGGFLIRWQCPAWNCHQAEGYRPWYRSWVLVYRTAVMVLVGVLGNDGANRIRIWKTILSKGASTTLLFHTYIQKINPCCLVQPYALLLQFCLHVIKWREPTAWLCRGLAPLICANISAWNVSILITGWRLLGRGS